MNNSRWYGREQRGYGAWLRCAPERAVGSSPEGEDNESSDDEYGSEEDEDVVAGLPPTCVIEHLR